MSIRRLLAAFFLVWATAASAGDTVPATQGPGTAIWAPVSWPAYSGGTAYYLPPPYVWWLWAIQQQSLPQAPATVQVSMPEAPSLAVQAEVMSPPVAPLVQADPENVTVQALAPLSPEPAQLPAAMNAEPAKKKTNAPRAAAKPRPTKVKPRKLCWKDNTLSPCP